MKLAIEEGWNRELGDEFACDSFRQLSEFVDSEYAAGEVYPPADRIFRAFELTPFDRVRVVIIGQDPYHEPGQAQGLAFYVPPEVKVPPSLANIAKEVGHFPDLIEWARQGVLLLNATLTVSAHNAGSHQNRGWEQFTDSVIRRLSKRRENLVFLLWGSYAQRKGVLIDRGRHLVLEAPHPSPLSAYRGFFGCGHFTKCNDYLRAHGQPPIAW